MTNHGGPVCPVFKALVNRKGLVSECGLEKLKH